MAISPALRSLAPPSAPRRTHKLLDSCFKTRRKGTAPCAQRNGPPFVRATGAASKRPSGLTHRHGYEAHPWLRVSTRISVQRCASSSPLRFPTHELSDPVSPSYQSAFQLSLGVLVRYRRSTRVQPWECTHAPAFTQPRQAALLPLQLPSDGTTPKRSPHPGARTSVTLEPLPLKGRHAPLSSDGTAPTTPKWIQAWAPPVSFATTRGISFDFSPSA